LNGLIIPGTQSKDFVLLIVSFLMVEAIVTQERFINDLAHNGKAGMAQTNPLFLLMNLYN